MDIELKQEAKYEKSKIIGKYHLEYIKATYPVAGIFRKDDRYDESEKFKRYE